jgi:predicted nucleotidyltransferase
MKYPTVFHLVSDILDKAGIPYVLIGGFAVNHYKVTRQTADIDFLIADDAAQKVSGLFKNEGYQLDYSQEVFSRLRADRAHLMDLDFMFVDRGTLDKIINAGKKIEIAGCKFIVPSLEHLIALKLHAIKYNPKSRESRDLPDIIELIMINKVKVKDKEFRDLCLKYGTEELYQRILERT